MKRTVLIFGLISGVMSSVMMLLTVPFLDRIGFDHGEIFGYSAIVLSFLLVFFGVRSYRDNVAGGALTFGRALAVGLLISLISCAFYVATWELIYYKLAPGFLDKYTAHVIEKARAGGAPPEQLQATAVRMEEFKKLYQNPLVNIAFTFLEPFPIGFLVSLISAGVLRRRAGPGFGATASSPVR